MANNATEVIRYVFDVTGDAALTDAAKSLLSVGDVSDETAASIRALADEFAKVQQAKAAASSYDAVRAEQERLAESTDALGLRLKLASENESELARQLDEKKAATAAAIAAQDAYRASEDRTTAGTRAHADAVRQAKAEQREASVAYADASAVLADSTRQYTANADAQARVEAELALLASRLDSAGVDTQDLSNAQQHLAQQSQGLAAQIQALALEHDQAAQAARRAAAAEDATLSTLRESLARHGAAERATENLARARELLAQRNATANASEQQSNQTLGISATKIAALGAAALGIGSAMDLAKRGVTDLLAAASDFQNLDLQLDRKFGDQADAALDKINEFKSVIPGVQDAFLRLKSFGLDPLDGSFDAIINKSADLGGSMETLQGISLALGQAWAKEKLQGEEILQLVERGVPVWDLLSKATGKNVQELQKLSSEGKLGKDVIRALINEIGKSAEGAADALGGTLPGQINKLKQQYQDFLKAIANSGVLEYLVQQLGDVAKKVEELAQSGELQAWARSFAEGIVSTGTAIKGFVGFLLEHKEAIFALAAAWGASKLVDTTLSFGNGLVNLAKNSGAAGVGLKGLASNAGLAAGAVIYTANNLAELVDVIGELIEVNNQLARIEADAAAQRDANRSKAAAMREELAQYADQARLTTEQLSGLSAEEQQRYADSLLSAQRYWQAVKVEAAQAGDATAAAVAVEKINAYGAALEKAGADMASLGAAAKLASRDVVMEGVSALMERLSKLRAESGSTAAALAQIAKEADFKAPEAPAILAKSIKYLGVEGQATVDTLGRAMIDALAKLDAQTLGNFEANAVKALQDGKIAAGELADILDITLQASLQKLGVSANAAGAGITTTGAEMIATFKLVANNAQASGDQIGAALKAAVASASTKAELDELGANIAAAAQRGALSVGQTERAMVSLRARVRELAEEANPLADAFARLGIESQQSLDAARDSAVEAFSAIVAGAREGLASQEDVKRAWVAQAQAQLDAAKDVEPWKRATVESQIAAQASIYGTTDALEQLGIKGKDAGDEISEGMVNAKAATDDAAESARLATLGYGDLLYAANTGNEAAKKMLQATKDGTDTTSRAATGQQSFAAGIVAVGTAAAGTTAQLEGLEIASESFAAKTRANYASIANEGGHANDYLASTAAALRVEQERLEQATAAVNARYSDQVQIADLVRRAGISGTVILDQTVQQLESQKAEYADLSEQIRGPYIAAIDQAIAKVKEQEAAVKAATAARRSQGASDGAAEATTANATADAREREADAAQRTAEALRQAGSSTAVARSESTIIVKFDLGSVAGSGSGSAIDFSTASNAQISELVRRIMPEFQRQLEQALRNSGAHQ